MSTALTKHERADLAECESIIERAIAAFDEFGRALRDIRDRRLYREKYGTFDEYCQQRWGVKSSRARQLISAATVSDDIAEIAEPANESQLRPLAPLATADRQDAWSYAVTAAGGQPTGSQVADAVNELADLRAAVSQAGGVWYSSRDGKHQVGLPDQPTRGYSSEELRAALGLDTVIDSESVTAVTVPAPAAQLASPDDERRANLSRRAEAIGYSIKWGPGGNATFKRYGQPYGGALTVDDVEDCVLRWEFNNRELTAWLALSDRERIAQFPAPALAGDILAGFAELGIEYFGSYVQQVAQPGLMTGQHVAVLEGQFRRTAVSELRIIENARAHWLLEDVRRERGPLVCQSCQKQAGELFGRLCQDCYQARQTSYINADDEIAQQRQQEHTGQLLAGVLDRLSDEECRIVCALTVEDYDPAGETDPREELWLYWTGMVRDNPSLIAQLA